MKAFALLLCVFIIQLGWGFGKEKLQKAQKVKREI